jgi:hypothetical protein
MTHDVWVHQKRFVALRWVVRVNGRTWRNVGFENIKFDVDLSDDDFQTGAPEGVTTVQVRRGQPVRSLELASPDEVRRVVGVRVLQPKWVPGGYRLTGYSVAPPSPMSLFRRRVSVRYAAGERIILLSMGPLMPRGEREPGEREASSQPTEVRPGVYFWTKHNVRLALIGPRDADRDDLRRCAESVDWYADGRRHRGR